MRGFLDRLHWITPLRGPAQLLSSRRRPRFRASYRYLTLSSVEGPTTPALLNHTLPRYFAQEILAKHSDRPALVSKHENAGVHGGPRTQRHSSSALDVVHSGSARLNGENPPGCLAWDFEELDRHVQALARGLVKMGIEKGDRVGVVMGNSSAYAMLQWGCARIGAIIVTINPAYHMDELISMLNLVGVKALFLVPRLRTSHYSAALLSSMPSLGSLKTLGEHGDPLLPSLRSIVLVNNMDEAHGFQRELQSMPSAEDFREVLIWDDTGPLAAKTLSMSEVLSKDEVINLQFTSGTTGLPKAVSLTHENLLNNAFSIGNCMRLTERDKLCNLAAWVHGACIVYASQTYDPRAVLRTLVQEECTAVHGVPTHFLGLLDEVENADALTRSKLKSLRTGIAAGSPIPIELMRQLIDKLNLIDLSIAYGMTETSPVSFQTVPSDPLIKRVETVGKIQPHVRAKIVGENNEVLPIGQPGELCVSGYLVQEGYWGDPDHTAKVIRTHEGDQDTQWMHTGDVGILDEEGYLRIVGRIKDVIIRGGENLFPVQIENVMGAHPAIHEVAVVSVPDAIYGEVVGAWIMRRGSRQDHPLTREEARAWVVSRMNPQNAPSWIWFLGEDGLPQDLPKTASGKVQKNILRKWSFDLAQNGIGRVKHSFASGK